MPIRTQIKEKKEKTDLDQNNQQNQSQSESEQNPSEFQEQLDEKQLGDAIEAFQTDSQAQENGLKATLSGDGPGLKVVLKDCEGHIVRQFTGEEFLRLRSASTKGDRICGKILDQKL